MFKKRVPKNLKTKLTLKITHIALIIAHNVLADNVLCTY